MEETLLMNVGKGFCQLPCDKSDLFIFQYSPFLPSFGDQFVQIFFDVFKHKIGIVADSDHFFQFYDVGVRHFAQRLNL